MPGRQHIGGSKLIGEPVQMTFVISAGTLTNDNGFRSIFLDDGIKLFDNSIQRCITGGQFPSMVGVTAVIQIEVGKLGLLCFI